MGMSIWIYSTCLVALSCNYINSSALAPILRRRALLDHPDTVTVNLRSGAEQKVVFITARVHPGETPSSFVCQGIIDFLVSQHPIAKVLRDHLVFKIAPMLNPDGVYLGNYRCSLMGFDLNRHWVDPSPWAHPTLHGVKQLIVQMYNNPKISLEFYIDIHAHSTMMNGFMYGNIFEEEERFQRQAIFPKLLCQNAEDFSFSSTSFNRDAVKAGTGRRFLGGLLDHSSYCYTLEVSFYSYILGGTTSTVPYTEEAYMKLGRNVARTFLDYYRLNTISERPLAPIPNTRTPASFSAQDRPVLGMNQGCVVYRTPAPFVAELGRKEKMPPFKCATQRGPGNSHPGRKLEKRSQTNPTEHSHSS